MRYYYAIVHCNNSKTACALYDEYNGFEFENSNLRLMMSIVPPEVEFTQDPRDEATDVPMDYEFNFDQQKKLNRALGHTSVKLTWD